MNKLYFFLVSRYFLLIFISIHVSCEVFSQLTTLDSLEHELLVHKKKDTIRINLLTNYVQVATEVDIPKAEEALKEAEELALKLDYSIGIAHVNYRKAWIEMSKSNYSTAIKFAHKSLTLYKQLGDKQGESFSLNCIGAGYYHQSEYQKAMEYFNKSAVIDEERKDFKGVSGSYLNIGNILADQGKFEESLAYYFKALKLKRQVEDDLGIAKCLGNIGSIYGEQGNYPKALEFFKQAQAQYEKLDNSANAAICYLNIGSVYLQQENFQVASESFKKALKLGNDAGDKKIIEMAYSQMGRVYSKMNNYPEALLFHGNALRSSRETNNQREVAISLNNIAGILLIQKKYKEALEKYTEAKKINEENEIKMGLCTSLIGISTINFQLNKTQKALEDALLAQTIADESSFLALQRECAELLTKIYTKLGRFDKALANHQQFKLYSDSIFNKEKIEKIAQIEYDYKFQKEKDIFNAKEKKLTKKVESTSKDLEKSQNRLLWGVVLFLTILLIALFIIFQMRIRNVRSKSENSLLEQKLLRSQMTPHFIFNSLSVLQGMILNKEEVKANQYLYKFSRLLRITLESSREKMTPLSQELLALEHYVALQNLESDKPIEYIVEMDETIQMDEILIPPMLIQPFIENAIEHGFTGESIEKKIEVSVYFNEQKLHCIIKDNGIGLEATMRDSSSHKKSLATSITKERIALLSKELKNGGMVEIEDRKKWNEQGTEVTLVIPHKIKKV